MHKYRMTWGEIMARILYPSLFIVFLLLISLSLPQPSYAGGLISTDMEVEIGKSARDEILSENELWEDPYDNELVQKLAEAVLPFCDQRDIEYEFYVIKSDEINAFALPGGFIFVTNGLLDFANRDPGLIAGVLAHEIGHVALRHHKKSMEDALWQNLGLAVLFQAFDIDEEWIQIAGGAALLLVQQGYSRENEYEADRHGVRATYRAGFDPETGLVEFLGMVEEKYGSDNDLGDVGRSLQSHPDTDRRVFFAENYLTELKAAEEFQPQPFPEIEAKPASDEDVYPEDEDKPGQYVIYQGNKD
ncbi:MAG: M48 family metalloprotease [bacterium]|nr:M48 family metalloprotease [bacterium]